jgi:hypothetical protein
MNTGAYTDNIKILYLEKKLYLNIFTTNIPKHSQQCCQLVTSISPNTNILTHLILIYIPSKKTLYKYTHYYIPGIHYMGLHTIYNYIQRHYTYTLKHYLYIKYPTHHTLSYKIYQYSVVLPQIQANPTHSVTQYLRFL